MTTNFMIVALAFALNTNGMGMATHNGFWSRYACPMTATVTWQSSTGCVYQVQRKALSLNQYAGWEAIAPMMPASTNFSVTNQGLQPEASYTNPAFSIPGNGSTISVTFGEPSFGEYLVEYQTAFYRVVQIE